VGSNHEPRRALCRWHSRVPFPAKLTWKRVLESNQLSPGHEPGMRPSHRPAIVGPPKEAAAPPRDLEDTSMLPWRRVVKCKLVGMFPMCMGMEGVLRPGGHARRGDGRCEVVEPLTRAHIWGQPTPPRPADQTMRPRASPRARPSRDVTSPREHQLTTHDSLVRPHEGMGHSPQTPLSHFTVGTLLDS
jgi:hypothetical protein